MGWSNSVPNDSCCTVSAHHSGLDKTRRSCVKKPVRLPSAWLAAPLRCPSERRARTPSLRGQARTVTLCTGKGGTLGAPCIFFPKIPGLFFLNTPRLRSCAKRLDASISTEIIGTFKDDRQATHRSRHTNSRVFVEVYHRPSSSAVVSMAILRASRHRASPAAINRGWKHDEAWHHGMMVCFKTTPEPEDG